MLSDFGWPYCHVIAILSWLSCLGCSGRACSGNGYPGSGCPGHGCPDRGYPSSGCPSSGCPDRGCPGRDWHIRTGRLPQLQYFVGKFFGKFASKFESQATAFGMYRYILFSFSHIKGLFISYSLQGHFLGICLSKTSLIFSLPVLKLLFFLVGGLWPKPRQSKHYWGVAVILIYADTAGSSLL